MVRLPPPEFCERDGSLVIEVTWVDGYGNVQLAAGPEALHGRCRLSVAKAGTAPADPSKLKASTSRSARVVDTFADLAPGELGILVDSYGSLALCLNSASAADLLGAAEQDVLWLRPIDVEAPAALPAMPLPATTGPATTGPAKFGPTKLAPRVS